MDAKACEEEHTAAVIVHCLRSDVYLRVEMQTSWDYPLHFRATLRADATLDMTGTSLRLGSREHGEHFLKRRTRAVTFRRSSGGHERRVRELAREAARAT